jgi:hypothetical protein
MPQINVTIHVRGRAARRVYVEHLAFGVPIGLYITDDQGRVRDNDGNLGISSLTANADIRILGQNSVARILQGGPAGSSLPLWVDKPCTDGVTHNLNTAGEHEDHFRILNRAVAAYDNVHRQFRPFSGLANPDFPLGRQARLDKTKDQAKRIEIVFPDQLPQPLAFSEPKSLSTGFPLIHVKTNAEDERLFGTGGQLPTIIPSELSHALHFSQFTDAGRSRITNDYVTFILSNMAGGGPGTHDIGIRTSPLVAFVEAMDHFSSRFSEFVRQGVSTATGAELRKAFFRAELDPASYWFTGRQVGTRTGNVVTPAFTGGDDEGAIYGAIFLDFSRRAGMLTAVNAYYLSGALTFGEYRNWVIANIPQQTAAINAVAQTWGL